MHPAHIQLACSALSSVTTATLVAQQLSQPLLLAAPLFYEIWWLRSSSHTQLTSTSTCSAVGSVTTANKMGAVCLTSAEIARSAYFSSARVMTRRDRLIISSDALVVQG
jgi:hypothetical protein